MAIKTFHIGIAGAGISGLMAGLELISAGHAVTIFEARQRTGGRIQSLEVDGMVVETGPEFIHGDLHETIGLLKKYKIRYNPTEGKSYTAKKGELKESLDMDEGWELLLEKMKSLDKDLPFAVFLKKYFPESRFRALRQTATGFAEGFDLADTQRASTRALYAEWEHGEAEQYRIPAGYGTLIHSMENEFIEKGGKILLNHPVESVERNAQDIKIHISGGATFSLDKLIVSLPLSAFDQEISDSESQKISDSESERISVSVSQKLSGSGSQKLSGRESILFNPSLGEKQEAFSQIGFGTVVKIVMIWESAFWKPVIPEAQFIFSDQFIPTWWTKYPMDLPMLTGWLGGPKAARVADEVDDFILDKAIESLSGIFAVSAETIKKGLKHAHIFNWKKEPWSRGAYSYALAGYDNAKSDCRKSIEDRIYFTGEAYYEGSHPGTVEAAVVNGRETARLLLREIK